MNISHIEQIIVDGIKFNAHLREIEIPSILTIDDALKCDYLYKDKSRFISFIAYINGLYTSGKPPIHKSKRMTRIIETCNYNAYCYLIYYFIVNNQIFGDGNHRTANYIIDNIINTFDSSNQIHREELEQFFSQNTHIDFTVLECNFVKWWDIHEHLKFC